MVLILFRRLDASAGARLISRAVKVKKARARPAAYRKEKTRGVSILYNNAMTSSSNTRILFSPDVDVEKNHRHRCG